MSTDRPSIEVSAAPGGWPDPWPSVAELAETLPAESWTLVGGLMTQLHTIHHGLGIVRPTNDVDIVLHIETMRGVPNKVAAALEALGYQFQPSIDPRNNTAHRFVRGTTKVDLVAGAHEDQVDVLIADHPAPRVIERLRGHEMIRIEGGTQALRRTVNTQFEITPGTTAMISVPRPFGALILKSAAYTTDSRDKERHLFDAAALLACIDDPFAERAEFTGSDRRRIATLATRLDGAHPAWRALPEDHRTQAQLTLELLARSDEDSATGGPTAAPARPRSAFAQVRPGAPVTTTTSDLELQLLSLVAESGAWSAESSLDAFQGQAPFSSSGAPSVKKVVPLWTRSVHTSPVLVFRPKGL